MIPPLASIISGLGSFWAKRRIRKQKGREPLVTLKTLLGKASQTQYGRQYGFEAICRSADPYTAFCRRVPVIDYEDWVAWLGDKSPLQEPVPLNNMAWPGTINVFCLSSGTTSGRTKFLPYSNEMAAVNRSAALDFFAHALAAQPAMTPPLAKPLYMTGSTQLSRNDSGVLCGDMSALTKYLAPKVLESISLPKRSVSDMEPWSARLKALIHAVLDQPRIGSISGVPIWQLSFLEALQEKAQKPLHEVLPQLRFLIHGGMSIQPYRQRLAQLLGTKVEFLEVYAASELGIAAFGVPGEQGMRFVDHYDVFYEFEDPDGIITTREGLRAGVPYAVICSSCAGLWRYRIGDKLVFRQTEPLILDYVTRDKTTSTFDEKVTERELERAMASVSPSFADFSLGPEIETRRHVWFVITKEKLEPAWLKSLDDSLRANNQDYDDYRGDGRIKEPKAIAVPDRGDFLRFLGRDEGGQRKFPRLLSPEETIGLVKQFGNPN